MKKSLQSLSGMFVQFTAQPGVLRKLQPKDDIKLAQGLHFNCPVCSKDKSHGVTLLFDLDTVPEKAKPIGRYLPEKFFSKLSQVSLGEVKSPYCHWVGSVVDGEVLWK